MGASVIWEEAGTAQSGEENTLEDLIHVGKYLLGGNEKEGPRLVSMVPSDKTKGTN